MKLVDKLSDMTIRNAKPKAKPVRLFDGSGLYIEISPAGGKLWRMKYRYGGKEKRLSFGAYPSVGLKDARARRDEARKMLDDGKDPGAFKQVQKAAIKIACANSFESIAREWYSSWKTTKAESYYPKVIGWLENDVFPWLGNRPVAEITSPDVLTVLRRIESRGAKETARRIKDHISAVFRYAIATGRAERDPCPDLRGALLPPLKKHMASIVDPVRVGELMRAIDQYKGSYIVRAALALAPLAFVRIGELRTARWADIDLENGDWSYTVSKTKTDHLVPLARQAVSILRSIHSITGSNEFVFPGTRHGRPISNMTVNRALQNMGYDTQTEMTGHDFRAMARTLLAEQLLFKPEVIEHQLAHRVPDALGAAYNRTKFLKERREMMQSWADYLYQLKAGHS